VYLPEHRVTLEPLTAEHAAAVLAFEVENRAYFAGFISDRGDDYFASFPARHEALLAEQDAGICRFHVLVDAAGAVVGRVNLIDLENGSADLGYRIAAGSAGRGLATAAVRAVIELASTEYGLTRLTAGTTHDNVRSQAVLKRVGFRQVGEGMFGGRPGPTFELRLEGA
jgi:[ribosomal protein S5]-alanine N-acetyltransferase